DKIEIIGNPPSFAAFLMHVIYKDFVWCCPSKHEHHTAMELVQTEEERRDYYYQYPHAIIYCCKEDPFMVRKNDSRPFLKKRIINKLTEIFKIYENKSTKEWVKVYTHY